MNTRSRRFRWLSCAVILAVTALFAAPPSGWASLAPSGLAAEARSGDMKAISSALESKAVRGRLKALGLDEKEVDSRLRRLSDAEIRQLATRLEAVRPGGVVVEVLVIAALVLLVIYLAKRV